MKCPSCAGADLVHDTRDMPYIYKGETTVIPAVTGEFCPACDESILDADESRRTMCFMLEFNKQVNASIVDPNFIVSVAKNCYLTNGKRQKFSAWCQCLLTLRKRQNQTTAGTGQIAQILDRHPDLLNEVRA